MEVPGPTNRVGCRQAQSAIGLESFATLQDEWWNASNFVSYFLLTTEIILCLWCRIEVGLIIDLCCFFHFYREKQLGGELSGRDDTCLTCLAALGILCKQR